MSPRQPDRTITMRAWLLVLAALIGVPPGSAGIAAFVGGAEPGRIAPRVWETLPPTPVLPTPARQGFVAVDGGRVWYGEYGVRNRGVPVLLLHGGLASSDYYGRLIPALTGAGYRVIAMDSRGHGRSSVSARPYSYALMARDVTTLLDRVGVRQVEQRRVERWRDHRPGARPDRAGAGAADVRLRHQRVARRAAHGL